MSNNKNAVSKSHPKSAERTNSNAHQKHSAPFYICPRSLCNNRRLKQKRLKWAAAALNWMTRGGGEFYRNKKTDQQRHFGRRDFSNLKADVTIDLLSDDDNNDTDIGEAEELKRQAQLRQQQMEHLQIWQQQLLAGLSAPQSAQLQSHMPHLLFYPVPQDQLSLKAGHPKIALLPAAIVPNNSRRKSRPPKRHAEPVVMNYESIVLTDDSDSEPTPSDKHHHSGQNGFENGLPDLALLDISAAQQDEEAMITSPVRIAQVDDEVTVSLVPRSAKAGHHCSSTSTAASSSTNGSGPGPGCVDAEGKLQSNDLFPMLPDETTVHTVIANRIYELSLSKLREGLASCGIPEFAGDTQQAGSQSSNSPLPRKTKSKVNPPVDAIPQPGPVSLKLSSDLSISLISDDEEENDGPGGDSGKQSSPLLSAEKLLARQPQLAVQQIAVEPQNPTPRRRKLG